MTVWFAIDLLISFIISSFILPLARLHELTLQSTMVGVS